MHIRRSLLHLSHMVDQLNGDMNPVGLDWRSFKLTFLLKEAFTNVNGLSVVVHAHPHRAALSSTLVC